MKIAEMKVEYVDHMGNDLSVVNAARVSFAKKSSYEMDSDGPYTWSYLSEKDVKLINYLAKHKHWTPFAHAFISLRIKAPIFVARQAVKHQVGLAWNEVSRRYVDDEPEFWFPKTATGWRGKPENAKQGSAGVMPGDVAMASAMDAVATALEVYTELITTGYAPEQARMVLPLNTMTEWIWSGSLAAFCRVCKLRLDPHAQLEIQELAEGIKAVVEPLFPVSFPAMMEN